MTAIGLIFGNPAYWDEDQTIWRWESNDEPAYRWGGKPLPCPQCGDLPTPEGHDPCLGHIPGVRHACCGHGLENGVIVWQATGGDRLRQARQERGLSLRDVAPQVGISISYLSALERDRKPDPSLSVARQIARFYEQPLDDLFPDGDAATEGE